MLDSIKQFEFLRSDYMNLIIMPTEACNFRCTYCYETFENKKMSRETIDGLKALIERRAGELNELEITWFGGEPLLAFDVVTEICQHAQRMARDQDFDFKSSMTTNAYHLDKGRFLECLNVGVRGFQISLDGDAETHNASRRLASGAGTFDRIWANLKAMRPVSADFSILIRLHYTFENYLSVGNFARRLGEELENDPRFQIMFHSVERLGGPNDETITHMSDEDKHRIEDHLVAAAGQERGSIDDGYVCYAARGNSLVVRSTGRLAKCTVALYDECNDIGVLTQSGEIRIDQEKFRRWISPVVTGLWDVAGCPLNWVVDEAMHNAPREHSAPERPLSALELDGGSPATRSITA